MDFLLDVAHLLLIVGVMIKARIWPFEDGKFW